MQLIAIGEIRLGMETLQSPRPEIQMSFPRRRPLLMLPLTLKRRIWGSGVWTQ